MDVFGYRRWQAAGGYATTATGLAFGISGLYFGGGSLCLFKAFFSNPGPQLKPVALASAAFLGAYIVGH